MSFEAAEADPEAGLEADLRGDTRRPRGRGRAPSHWRRPGTAGPWSVNMIIITWVTTYSGHSQVCGAERLAAGARADCRAGGSGAPAWSR